MPTMTAGELAALREVLGPEQSDLVDGLRRQYEGSDFVEAKGHELADARSLAIHRLIAERVRQDPSIAQAASRRVERWLEEGKIHPTYARAWKELLTGPLDQLVSLLQDPGERARAMRQCTPFLGVFDQTTRLRIWRETREPIAS